MKLDAEAAVAVRSERDTAVGQRQVRRAGRLEELIWASDRRIGDVVQRDRRVPESELNRKPLSADPYMACCRAHSETEPSDEVSPGETKVVVQLIHLGRLPR